MVQKAGRVANRKRKAVEISHDKAEVAPEIIVTKRAKKVVARDRALRRPVRRVAKTAKVRPDNTK